LEVFEAAAIYFSSGKNNSLRSDIFFPAEKHLPTASISNHEVKHCQSSAIFVVPQKGDT